MIKIICTTKIISISPDQNTIIVDGTSHIFVGTGLRFCGIKGRIRCSLWDVCYERIKDKSAKAIPCTSYGRNDRFDGYFKLKTK